MDTQEIQKRISKFNDKLVDRGFVRPDCEFQVSNERFWVALRAQHPSGEYDNNFSEYISGDTPEDVFQQAEVQPIPDIEERLKQDFVKSLGKLIDKGREIGIDVDFINPLEASMRKLSENILEHTSV